MRNIWKIFLGDVKHLRTNVIAWIIIIGITVVPSLYAWFNIAASWDPYGNTGNLKIAVANEDEGYTGQLLSTELNMGDLVIARLSRNTKMKWTFTTSADAIDGVESGKYYAAVVIPSSFSSDMMSLFSKNVHETKILYYLNEKANAIAPKITDKGAGSIQRGIREEVTKVVADVSLNTLTDLSDQLNNVETDGIAQNFLTNMQNIESGLSTSAATLRAFSSLVDSLDIMLTSTSDLLKTTGTNITDNTKNLSDAASQVPALTSDFSGITDTINTMLAQLSDSYSGLSTQIDGSFDSIGSNVRDSSQSVEGVKNEVSAILTDFTAVR
ncbi:MAG: YhgE/Pip family protein, partial [Eubacterium sp.]|nr:YhgE/Pip family protein [Eubacterium sp.]